VSQTIEEKINQLRRKMLVHSYLYYSLATSIIDDFMFDNWAKELVTLQKEHPHTASQCVYAEDFKNFDATTGYDLPRDYWVEAAARRVLSTHKEIMI
jgi:hypothetical protein